MTGFSPCQFEQYFLQNSRIRFFQLKNLFFPNFVFSSQFQSSPLTKNPSPSILIVFSPKALPSFKKKMPLLSRSVGWAVLPPGSLRNGLITKYELPTCGLTSWARNVQRISPSSPYLGTVTPLAPSFEDSPETV